MRLYQSYIIRAILPVFAIIALLLISIIWITQILKLLYLLDNGIRISQFVELVVYMLPALIYMILPIITLISILYVYNKLRNQRQLIILSNSGLTNMQLSLPAIYVGILATIFAYYLSVVLVPYSYAKLKEKIDFLRNNYASNIIVSKTFTQISRDITIYVDRKNKDGTFDKIILFDNNDSDRSAILFAEYGRILTDNNEKIVELHDGVRHGYDSNEKNTKLSFEVLSVKIVEKPHVSDRGKDSMELYIGEMLFPSKFLAPDKQNKLLIEASQRLTWPMFNIIFALITISVFVRQNVGRKTTVINFIAPIVPIFIFTYIHFSLQKMIYKDMAYFYLCYLNMFLAAILSFISFKSFNNIGKKIRINK